MNPIESVSSVQALCQRVKNSAADGTPLHVVGAQSKAHWGPTVLSGARMVTLAKMAGIVSYQPGDLVVTVNAGTRLQDLQNGLAAHNQWLPIDPPCAGATIGGILATASAGPRRFGYRPIRDHLLGLKVIGTQGVVTQSGGRVVKNVTGFDLHRLHTGAFGRLGAIVEATFKVATRPATRLAWLWPFANTMEAFAALNEIRRGVLCPVSLQILSGSCARNVAQSVGLPSPGTWKNLALVGVEGSHASVQRHIHDLGQWAPTAAVQIRDEACHTLWRTVADAPEADPTRVCAKVATTPSDLASALHQANAAGITDWRADVAMGTLWAALPDTHVQNASAQVTALHGKAQTCGGYAVVQSAPVSMHDRDGLPFAPPASDDVWRTHLAMSEQVRNAFDPHGIFNPIAQVP